MGNTRWIALCNPSPGKSADGHGPLRTLALEHGSALPQQRSNDWLLLLLPIRSQVASCLDRGPSLPACVAHSPSHKLTGGIPQWCQRPLLVGANQYRIYRLGLTCSLVNTDISVVLAEYRGIFEGQLKATAWRSYSYVICMG